MWFQAVWVFFWMKDYIFIILKLDSLDLHYFHYVYISLLIISCIIEYVTNKITLNLDVEKSS